jgi:hypothetical protein
MKRDYVRGGFNMARKRTALDVERLYYANLAVTAEQAGNFEDAANQWRRAAGASVKSDVVLLYEEAAKRCERRSQENPDKTCGKSVGD